MDFDDSPEEAEFRAQARAWLDANAPRRGGPGDFASDTGHDDDFVKACKAWQARLREAGWAGLTWPTEYGGRGLGPGFEQIFHEEQAAYGVSSAMFAVGTGMAGPTIIEHGTEAQKARFLPALLRGEDVWCQLFSEPGAGSDLAGITTRAERHRNGGWVVNGQKVWTSYARHSDFGILLARTNPDRPKHRGITYFLLDMSTPGIEVRPISQMNGSSEFNEVFLTDVRVPDDGVLGAVDDGWRVAMSTLASERGLVGTDWPGFSELLDAARAARRTGDPVTRQRLVEVYTGEQLLRFLGYRAKTALGRGEPLGPLASSINLLFASHLKRTGDIVLSVLGPHGLVRDHAGADADWTYLFLTWPCVRIASGTDEIQRNILGERALGLPSEPRVDKDVPFEVRPRRWTPAGER
ncbi:MAG TPA: acyl-CoA dehydrogenase family protein [Acidimicrobiales bacterium]|nr:acyl-CoA dehydrogenase family protein [Acidimicrobiales bacterium]